MLKLTQHRRHGMVLHQNHRLLQLSTPMQRRIEPLQLTAHIDIGRVVLRKRQIKVSVCDKARVDGDEAQSRSDERRIVPARSHNLTRTLRIVLDRVRGIDPLRQPLRRGTIKPRIDDWTTKVVDGKSLVVSQTEKDGNIKLV